MTNPLYRARLNGDIDALLVEARNCSATNHPGLVGTIREILVEKLLLPLLPEGVEIGSGKITDADGNLSAQTDIVIYDRLTVPPLMYNKNLGIFPIESVYYAIEVKSQLTASEFETSINNGIALRALSGPQPNSLLFAFSSDLKDSKDSQRFIQRQKDMLVPLPVNIFCVVGREYGYWKDRWNTFAPPNRHDEVAALIIGIVNTLVTARRERQSTLDFGRYFLPSS